MTIMLEGKLQGSSRKSPDLVTDELIDIMQKVGVLEFNEIFLQALSAMKEKKMPMSGEEILRLRIYDKLQNLVSAGGLMKKGKVYTATAKLPTLKSR